MKTIGLIGGLSWESTAEYYRLINQETQRRLGGVHSAECLLWSFDFGKIEQLQASGAWDDATRLMVQAAQRLERGGAECLLICSNTMHRMADEVQAGVAIPLIHIADPTAKALAKAGLQQVALLGTRYTMEQTFYRARLEAHGFEVRVPNEAGRALVNKVIYEELIRGVIRPESRQAYQQVIQQMADEGAQSVILGCTEIGLLIKPSDSVLPSYDTTHLHALAAVDFALS